MKRAWTKFWLWASALALAAAASDAVTAWKAQDPPHTHRANELTLAGLRPGNDTLAAATRRYKEKYEAEEQTTAKTIRWWDRCHGRSLRLELDGKSLIQAVVVTALAQRDMDCQLKRGDSLGQKYWATGRGLRLGDPQHRVYELYGEPASSGPSVRGTRELELLDYAFDWAGTGVPQAMKVFCDRSTGRVLEITLAFQNR